MAMLAAGPATEYASKLAFFNPVDLAVTVMVETVVGNCREVGAIPLPLVTTEGKPTIPPLLAENVTVTPLTPFPYASCAWTTRELGSVEPALPVCFDPPQVMILITGAACAMADTLVIPTVAPDMVPDMVSV